MMTVVTLRFPIAFLPVSLSSGGCVGIWFPSCLALAE